MRPLAALALAACAACRGPAGGEAPAPSASASATAQPSASAPVAASNDCDGGLGYGASCNGDGSGVGVPGKAHDPNAPRVEASLLSATAGLPGEVVIRIVRQNLPSLRRCYTQSLLDGGAVTKGQVRLDFEIDAAGKPAKVRDAGSTLATEVASCMARVMEAVSFPAPERAPVKATIEVQAGPRAP